ncbi:MAG: fumarylacetoacetate hydrolase family protein [Bryobacterales bacterium]|nr:fumarylacetoacetate hydrolase family protein [Bryobacterales bacterium]
MAPAAQAAPVKFVRFRKAATTAYGVLEGETIREIRGGILGPYKETGARHKLAEVKLLYPCEPSKVLAVALNYKSHLGAQKPPAKPEFFWKPVTCLANPGDPIVIPPDAANVHYEGELVIVIGKQAKNIPPERAAEVIFGATCGNDVSERDWQKNDQQWWRAKGADTFGPLGPVIVKGIDYGKLELQTRLNGQVVQKESTADLLFDCHAIVSFASRFVTLMPGDVIYTGTPGTTRPMKPGDVVEVELSGIGVLRNTVTG